MTAPSIAYALQEETTGSGQPHFTVIIPAREGRGIIQNPALEIVLAEGSTKSRGFVMTFSGEDGGLESLGDDHMPLPDELLESKRGFGIIHIDSEGSPVLVQVMRITASGPA